MALRQENFHHKGQSCLGEENLVRNVSDFLESQVWSKRVDLDMGDVREPSSISCEPEAMEGPNVKFF